MICQPSQKPKSLQIGFVYFILTSLGQLVSNPNWTAINLRGGRYRPSTSRFQKEDTVPLAVIIAAFFGVSMFTDTLGKENIRQGSRLDRVSCRATVYAVSFVIQLSLFLPDFPALFIVQRLIPENSGIHGNLVNFS